MVAETSSSILENAPTSGRLLSLPSDVLLLGLLADPDRLDPESNDGSVAEARKLPPAERYRWIRTLAPETKSELIARHLYGVI